MTMTSPAARTPSPTATRLRRANAAITWLFTFGLRIGDRCLWWAQLLQLAIATMIVVSPVRASTSAISS